MIYYKDDESACAEDETEAEIDVQILAQKVYELLKQDLRLTRERLGHGSYGTRQ